MVATGPDSAWEWGEAAAAAIYYMLVAGEADNHPHKGVVSLVSRVSVSLYLSYADADADAAGVCRVSLPTPLCPSALAVDRPHWPFAPPHTKPAGQRGNKREQLVARLVVCRAVVVDYPRRLPSSRTEAVRQCTDAPCQLLPPTVPDPRVAQRSQPSGPLRRRHHYARDALDHTHTHPRVGDLVLLILAPGQALLRPK